MSRLRAGANINSMDCGIRILIAGLFGAAVAAAATFQVPFTTEDRVFLLGLFGGSARKGAFGPDGPWQTIGVMLGNQSTGQHATYSAMWPTTHNYTLILNTDGGGPYKKNTTNPEEAVLGGVWFPDNDESAYFSNYTIRPTRSPTLPPDYVKYWENSRNDTLSVGRSLGNEYAQVNLPVAQVAGWDFRTRRNKNYTSPVGQVGLRNLVTELESTGFIGSQSFGMHIGSVAMNQPGSMVLGGYDRSRALGPVGSFNIIATTHVVFLVDVTLGVEEGISPFKAPHIDSVFQGLPQDNPTAVAMTRHYGGKQTSVLVQPDAAVPGIYLPSGTCETAAAHLPVTFDNATGYYLWNTQDPYYKRIVSSPAYMGFTLSDRDATNITIKVPFKLLNLTLEAPIVDTPTQYFPCMSRNSSFGTWALGRAFLQAAFYGANLDRNVTFLAQAPGPNMEQSVINDIAPSTVALSFNSTGSFVESWRGYWTPLDRADEFLESGGGGGVSMTTRALAITFSVVGAIALLCAGAFFWRRKKQTRTGEAGEKPPGSESGASELGDGLSGKQELDGRGERRCEMGESDAHEIDTLMDEKHEVPAFPLVYELPAESLLQKVEKAEGHDGTGDKKNEGREDKRDSPRADTKDTTSDVEAQR